MDPRWFEPVADGVLRLRGNVVAQAVSPCGRYLAALLDADARTVSKVVRCFDLTEGREVCAFEARGAVGAIVWASPEVCALAAIHQGRLAVRLHEAPDGGLLREAKAPGYWTRDPNLSVSHAGSRLMLPPQPYVTPRNVVTIWTLPHLEVCASFQLDDPMLIEHGGVSYGDLTRTVLHPEGHRVALWCDTPGRYARRVVVVCPGRDGVLAALRVAEEAPALEWFVHWVGPRTLLNVVSATRDRLRVQVLDIAEDFTRVTVRHERDHEDPGTTQRLVVPRGRSRGGELMILRQWEEDGVMHRACERFDPEHGTATNVVTERGRWGSRDGSFWMHEGAWALDVVGDLLLALPSEPSRPVRAIAMRFLPRARNGGAPDLRIVHAPESRGHIVLEELARKDHLRTFLVDPEAFGLAPTAR